MEEQEEDRERRVLEVVAQSTNKVDELFIVRVRIFPPAMLFLFWFKVNGTIVAWQVTDAVAFALNIMLEAKRYTKYDMRMRVGRTRLRYQD